MGWVTLDDGQHVFIGAGGKVAADRASISRASGATERGKALAAGSHKAILSKLLARHTEMKAKVAGPSLREQADAARAAKGTVDERARAIRQRSAKYASQLENRSRNVKIDRMKGKSYHDKFTAAKAATEELAARKQKALVLASRATEYARKHRG